jgi:hypothetical protein
VTYWRYNGAGVQPVRWVSASESKLTTPPLDGERSPMKPLHDRWLFGLSIGW